MKRLLAVVSAMLIVLSAAVTVSAEELFMYVTDAVYSRIVTGGVEERMLFTAYTDSGEYVIGTMDETGELTRESYSSARWDALVEDDPWKTTVHGDAGALCPYADSHTDKTVCPYLEVDLVSFANTVTGVTLEKYYVPTRSMTVFPSTGAHICFGRYGYVSPVTLKWDRAARYVSLKNSEGLWGVFDTETDTMATAYAYRDMSAVCGHYVKVSDGAAWGRLDLTGTTPTVYRYASEEAFSITEELREIADGQWQVFNADNEPISVIFEGDLSEAVYAPTAHVLLVTNSDQTATLYDLSGAVAASFSADQTVTYLQGDCFAVASNGAVALAKVNGVTKPEETVLMGDVNFDGAINSSDVRRILRHTVDESPLTARGLLAADLEGDTDADTNDARLLLRQILFR